MKKKRVAIATIILVLFLCIGIGDLVYRSMKTRQKVSRVKVARSEDGDFQLLVDGRPYFVKGVVYNPIPIGKGSEYNFWGDPNEVWKIDGALMKRMGINTVRFFQPGEDPEEVKKVINDLYRLYGIRTALGHYLGFWDWPPANYADPKFREEIKEEVVEMVKTYKDEPGIILWVLGSENNYSFDLGVNPWTSKELQRIEDPHQRKKAHAKIYYSFTNELAKVVKEIDPTRPVALGNGGLASIEVAKEVCPEVDLLGGIEYRGGTMGGFWRKLERDFGKPAVMLEVGSDSYNAVAKKEDQDLQALYIISQWKAIVKNAKGGGGVGNSLGGFIFEWTDEWWKHNEADPKGWLIHDTAGSWTNPSYYDGSAANNMNEEWFGVVAISPEKANGVNKRVPRKAYFALKELWTK